MLRHLAVVLAASAAAAAASAAPNRVHILQFSMAKCPMTTSWTALFAKEVMHDPELRAAVYFEQSYVGGDVGEGPVNATNWMRCYHGPSECTGHAVMLCARNVSQAADPLDDRWFDMVACMDGKDGIPGVTYGMNYSIPENSQHCAEKAGLDWGEVAACATGAQGQQLLHDSHFRTMALFAEHGGYSPPGHGYRPPLIPNIWIYDGATGQPTEYNNPLETARNPYADLKQRVCAAIAPGAPKPASCAASLL